MKWSAFLFFKSGLLITHRVRCCGQVQESDEGRASDQRAEAILQTDDDAMNPIDGMKSEPSNHQAGPWIF